MGQSKATIKFQDTGYFSKIMSDYLDQNGQVSDFYGNFPDLDGFGRQIEEKSASFTSASRQVLHSSLLDQSKGLSLSKRSKKHIDLLQEDTTFTVTTGHQLNLFTGPLYFLYKIISTINLATRLKKNFPEKNFVPVYWMATEDHDFEEICFFNYKGTKIQWNKQVSGAVGRVLTEDIQPVYDVFDSLLSSNKNAEKLRVLFRRSYLEHDTLTEATRFLANELFGDYGLVIIDGDDKDLKRLFVPYVKEELLYQTSFKEVTKTNERLGVAYPIQVNPREINLFYLDNALRERLVFEEGVYKVNNTNLVFSPSELLELLQKSPEKFSPNVLLRPLYQEVILPNLSYIGGGGEMAYWMQLKATFTAFALPFPILLLRNSVLLINEKQRKKMTALHISDRDIFKKQHELTKMKVKDISDLNLDFSEKRKALKEMFDELRDLSDQTDKSFTGAVLAQEKKQLNGLDHLEKRLLRAQKRKYKELVSRITILQDELFPKQSLQERQANFSSFYEIHGKELIPVLIAALDPLQLEFDIISPEA
ncbi:bacillithiol biosynthesis cysteine-adding enzyme BshC [Lutimonas sp.]|uniref:bacillithiol biosynthesis cysteine-adding enzyme BshC n=1 Tax=Lutimonas sp. TaxID=1872403 RepID=UPI003D9BB5E5